MEKLLKKLVSISSISGQEAAIHDYLCQSLRMLGLNPISVSGNVVVKISGKNKDRALIFNSHVDTVSPGQETQWKYPPFKGKVKDGKVWGLGASDEKAAIAVLLTLAGYYAKKEPECDIWFTFVRNEEIDGSGTKEVLNWLSSNYQNKYKNIAAVLGEPTNSERIEIGHRGNIFIRITTFGKSGHASVPVNDRDNAVFKMYKIINHLKTWFNHAKDGFNDETLGLPTLSAATSIMGGDETVPNKIADSCRITCDLRTNQKLHNSAVKLITKVVRKIDKSAEIGLVGTPATYGLTDIGEDIVRVFKEVTGFEISISETSNDMCFFTEKNIPAVVFGPGNPATIHKADEYCEIDKLYECLIVYKKVISEFARIG